jgi:hypothetical protein
VRHTATLHLKPCDTTVTVSPGSTKGGGNPLTAGDVTHTTTHSSALTHDIGTCLNHFAGTWRFLLLSHLTCSPPLRATRCLAIHRHERIPAERTTHSRNQDKPRVPLLLSTGHRETDLNASTNQCWDYFPHRQLGETKQKFYSRAKQTKPFVRSSLSNKSFYLNKYYVFWWNSLVRIRLTHRNGVARWRC